MKIGYETWAGPGGLKQFAQNSGLPAHRNDEGGSWYVFVSDGGVIHETRVYKDGNADEVDLNATISSFSGKVVTTMRMAAGEVVSINDSDEKKTNSGLARVVVEKSVVSRATIVTHDWTDPTTWYETSVRITDEIATNTGNNRSYKLAYPWVIDNYHSKMSKEDFLKNSAGQPLRVSVKINDVVKAEQDPHYSTGGDFLVNYEDGYIDFLYDLSPSDTVKVTYNRMVNSIFTFKPPTGKKFNLTMAEAQFAIDTEMNDSIVFQPRGKVDVFAPQLVNNPYPSGTIIPLENPTIYKAYSDFLNDAIKVYPVSKALGGGNWRATPIEMAVFNWDYVSSTEFRSDYGMEVQLRLQHDVPMSGWYATVTFYCTAESL